MKRRILTVFSILLILVGLFVLAKLTASTLAPRGKGALQVTTNLKANVLLNGKLIGTAPLIFEQDKTLASGVYDLKIIPEDKTFQSYTTKIKINPGVLTAVERTFLPGGLASAYVLTLEETNSGEPEIFIATVPDGALVSIDGESKNVTPYNDELSASEHEIEIAKVGFSKKTIRVRTVKNYKLVLNVTLGAEGDIDTVNPTAIAPSVTISPTTSPLPLNSVTINDTPVGFLRVRQTPSTAAQEIGRVAPGEKFEYTEENESWFKIKLADGTEGWISKTYARKN